MHRLSAEQTAAVSVGPDYYGFSNPAGGSSAMVVVSQDGNTWTTLPAPARNYLYGVTFGGNRFVTVGDRGTILVSSNAIEWVQAASETDIGFHRVGYGDGRYIATGSRGTITVSSNALDWFQVPPVTAHDLHGIAYGDGNYIVVGDQGTVLTSTNAVTWTPRPSGTLDDLFGVTYARDTFIIVGARGTILQSGTEPFTVKFARAKAHPTGFEAHLVGEPLRSYRIEASTNLVDWFQVSVVNRPRDGVTYLDATPTSPRKFYRAVAP